MALITVTPSKSVDPNLGRVLHGLRGIGNDCPSYAPYINAYGNCSNTPSAPASTPSGSPAVALPYNDPSSPYYQKPEYLPTGWVANTWTGRAEQQYLPNDYGAAESSQAAADAEGAAAMAAGRARGVNVTCRTVQNDGTPGFPGLYWSSCSVDGGTEQHDAGLLAAAGGIESAVMSEGAVAGTPYTSVPVLYMAPPPSAPAQAPAQSQQQAAAAQTQRPNQSVPPRDTSVSMETGIPRTGDLLAAAQGGVQQLSVATGLDSTTLMLIAAGAAAFFLLRK